MPRRPPIKPFVYGKYLVEYREEKGGLLRFYKERIDNLKEAEEIQKQLVQEGFYNPVIKQIG
tara:strand:+ start:29 stop:214 length:186 start_codon:yes stop_codon:yes gene_type:complete